MSIQLGDRRGVGVLFGQVGEDVKFVVAVVPNLTVIPAPPTTKFVPVIVTNVVGTPEPGPVFGSTNVTVVPSVYV